MTAYTLSFGLTTSDKDLFTVLMEQLQRMVNDCDPEDIDYELSQETHEGVE